MMEQQTTYIQSLQHALETHPAVKAAWLSGSFGRGHADRYSDIDLNVWLDERDVEPFRRGTQSRLDALRPLVLFRWMFNNRMANALTRDGLRLDLWLHTDAPALDSNSVKVLWDRDKTLQFHEAAPAALVTKERLLDQISEFWRCIALTPPVIGRDERIVSLTGLAIESNILTDVIIQGYGIPRESGVKRLNPFLPNKLRQEIEAALDLNGLTISSLAQAHLALARIMQTEGRQIATRHHFDYPTELENAALEYTMQELAALGVVAAER